MAVLARLIISPTIAERIRQAQADDQLPDQWFAQHTYAGLVRDVDGLYRMRGRLYVPDLPTHPRLRDDILHEAHYSRFTVHPGTVKMYHDMCRSFSWPGLKKDVRDTVLRCLVWQQVKIEHQMPGELLQPLPPLEWKWDCITCDFVTHLPSSRRQMDAVWVVVDRLTKSAHFILIRMTYPVSTLVRLYRG